VPDTVATVADARAALAVAPYDVIILDLGLPDEDGIALLGGLRAAGNQAPILVLTGRGVCDSRENSVVSGQAKVALEAAGFHAFGLTGILEACNVVRSSVHLPPTAPETGSRKN